ncbi:hypothetical protein [Paenibacillus sp. IITD108]|uniref:hypothetical protein n=1 Tax=Paenibacillus sp. IITD108 TaxID=3116649 RepID=UPI002F41A087
MEFVDLGIPVDAVESRTAAVCTNLQGESRIVIAAKGFLVVVQPESGECRQLPFPNEHDDYPYDTFSCSKGMLYMGAGVMFYAFDPFKLEYVAAMQTDAADELCGFSYAESADGLIYVTTYPRSQLYQYNPSTQAFKSLGSVDSEQKYPSHMAVDKDGWVYVGTGTVQKNIMALHPEKNGQINQLLPEQYRGNGIGLVRQGPNNQVFAQMGDDWFRLQEGIIREKIEEIILPPSLYHGSSFSKFHRQLPGNWKLVSHSLSDYELILKNDQTQDVKVIKLQYQSNGAMLSPLVIGPDQIIYGTSNHPLHFFSVDPKEKKPAATNWGAKAIEHGAGGNIAAYAVQGNIIAGAAYTHGRLHLIDTSKPLQIENNNAAGRNPKCVTEHIEIHRPRSAVALSDGEHIAYGGFPGYGMVGGGLAIYHLPTGKEVVLQHDQLVAKQSTVALSEMPQGFIIGGTSVETPGGAEPASDTAFIYQLNWRTLEVHKRWALRSGIREYSMLLVDGLGRIHTLTSCSRYMVWDPVNEQLLHEQDLSAWGSIVRQSWQLDKEENKIYGVLSKGIFTISLATLEPELLAVPPGIITAGFVKYKQRLFFAISTHLWSYTI